MNVLTGSLPDMVLYDNNLHVPLPDDYILDEYIPRISQDKVVIVNGHLLIDCCNQSSLRILNGRCRKDMSVGRTYNGHSGQSVIDYILVTSDLLNGIVSFEVSDPNIL